eukprot:1766979-Pleurochrysis_carterae.AAC.1
MSERGVSSGADPPCAGDDRVACRSAARGGDTASASALALARSVRAASEPLAEALAVTPSSARRACAPRSISAAPPRARPARRAAPQRTP